MTPVHYKFDDNSCNRATQSLHMCAIVSHGNDRNDIMTGEKRDGAGDEAIVKMKIAGRVRPTSVPRGYLV